MNAVAANNKMSDDSQTPKFEEKPEKNLNIPAELKSENLS